MALISGAVPSVIIIFLTNPMQGIYFLIMILVLQQVDGNIIAPKILGNSTGLSSFWVVVAIVVGGGLFGFFGMLLGVPTMALTYYLIGRFSKYLLRKKDLPEETDVYVHLKEVDLKTNEVVRKTVEEEERGYFFFRQRAAERRKRKVPKRKKIRSRNFDIGTCVCYTEIVYSTPETGM